MSSRRRIKKHEVIVSSNPKHKGLVDLKTVSRNERGLVGRNGITWVGVKT